MRCFSLLEGVMQRNNFSLSGSSLTGVSIFFLFLHRANKMSIESGDKTFYYMTRESLCFLAMTESKYPKRTAFLYLDEVCDLILQELIREFGNNVSFHGTS